MLSTSRFLLASSLASVGASSCIIKGDGFSWDLSAFAATTPLEFTDPSRAFAYALTLCGTSPCNDGTSSLCQKSLQNLTSENSLMTWDSPGSWRIYYGNTTVDKEFLNGALCNEGSNKYPRQVNLQIECSKEAIWAPEFNIVEKDEPCFFEAKLSIPEAQCGYCGPPSCNKMAAKDACDTTADANGACYWCDSTLINATCYSNAEAHGLPPGQFTCDFKSCSDILTQQGCKGSTDGQDGGPCAWCARTATADTGICANNVTAASLPPAVFACSV